MAERIQKPRTRVQKNTRTEVHEDSRTKRQRTRQAELDAELDELLDEIDGLLEENAEEFLASYVQKGGE